ncbi:MAG TPA: hypothetical protein VM115_14765 [Vicinamibacterales bacterium]|nr:hypothetical protein [Vicinamibacterales bacterium]
MRAIAVTLVVLVYVLHHDFWFWREARPLVFGFLPVGLFYHRGRRMKSAARSCRRS